MSFFGIYKSPLKHPEVSWRSKGFHEFDFRKIVRRTKGFKHLAKEDHVSGKPYLFIQTKWQWDLKGKWEKLLVKRLCKSYQKQMNISRKLCPLSREVNQVTALHHFTFKIKIHSLVMHLNLFLIGDNYFTTLYMFLPFINMNQPYVIICPLPLEPHSYVPPHPT